MKEGKLNLQLAEVYEDIRCCKGQIDALISQKGRLEAEKEQLETEEEESRLLRVGTRLLPGRIERESSNLRRSRVSTINLTLKDLNHRISVTKERHSTKFREGCRLSVQISSCRDQMAKLLKVIDSNSPPSVVGRALGKVPHLGRTARETSELLTCATRQFFVEQQAKKALSSYNQSNKYRAK